MKKYINLRNLKSYDQMLNKYPKKIKRYSITCKKCNATLTYTEKEQLGRDEVIDMFKRSHKLIGGVYHPVVLPVKMYINCCNCGNKVYTSCVSTCNVSNYGKEIEEIEEEVNESNN